MDKDLKTLLSGTMEMKNLSPEKLAQITNIPERYISALQNMEIDKLPAAPYVRAYLKKIAGVLNLDYDELWTLYEQELPHKTSGLFDTLPANRFAIQRLDKKIWFAAFAALLLLVYITLNINIFGTPSLEVTSPEEPFINVYESSVVLSGIINPKDKLTINGEEMPSDADGNFETSFNLQPGLNTIELKVKRFLGNETRVIRQVLYQPKENNKLIPQVLSVQ